jgi:hypothetical protein
MAAFVAEGGVVAPEMSFAVPTTTWRAAPRAR